MSSSSRLDRTRSTRSGSERCVLPPAIGVVNAGLRHRPSIRDSGPQGCESKRRIDLFGYGVSHDFATTRIEDRSQVAEAGGNPNEGDVPDPHEIGPRWDDIAI